MNIVYFNVLQLNIYIICKKSRTYDIISKFKIWLMFDLIRWYVAYYIPSYCNNITDNDKS